MFVVIFRRYDLCANSSDLSRTTSGSIDVPLSRASSELDWCLGAVWLDPRLRSSRNERRYQIVRAVDLSARSEGFKQPNSSGSLHGVFKAFVFFSVKPTCSASFEVRGFR